MAKNSKNQFVTKNDDCSSTSNIRAESPQFYKYSPAFSFKHYEHKDRNFSACCIKTLNDFHAMFERLQTMSQLQWKTIKNASHMYHFHPIEWHDTSRPNGIPSLSNKFKEVPPIWQFKNFKECRIIGFFNSENIFEIVWIDRDHKVYPKR